MEAHVFDALNGRLTATLNPEMFYTRYVYDADGREIGVYREVEGEQGEVKLIEKTHNFGKQ